MRPAASAYIHIPFCRRRCGYCDFAVIATGRRGPAPEAEARYIRAVAGEVAATAAALRRAGRAVRPLDTVYIGGGTPSLASDASLAAVLAALVEGFGVRGVDRG